jgi:hypothetical protein
MGTWGSYRDTRGKGAFEVLGEHNASFAEDEDARARSLARHHRTAVAHATSVEDGTRLLWIARMDEETSEVRCECIIYTKRADYFSEKSMDEGMGPAFYNVPDKVWGALTTLPEGEFAREWRDKVRERRRQGWGEAGRLKLGHGERVEFMGDPYGVGVVEYMDGKVWRYADREGLVRLRGWRGMTARTGRHVGLGVQS